jgi:hypothetical protein
VNGRGWDDVEFFAGTMTTKEEKILKDYLRYIENSRT